MERFLGAKDATTPARSSRVTVNPRPSLERLLQAISERSGLRNDDVLLRASSVLAEGYSFQVEMLEGVLKSCGRVAEIPIIFEERRHGKSRISRAEVLRAIGTVLRLARER